MKKDKESKLKILLPILAIIIVNISTENIIENTVNF